MQCPRCGSEISPGALRCYECSASSETSGASASAAASARSSRALPPWARSVGKGVLIFAAGMFLQRQWNALVLNRPAKAFQDMSFQAVSGSGSVALSGCPTPKCVTAYVAPWCGYCRAATPLIKALQSDLAGRGVTMRIIVGKDDPARVADYARDFGPQTLMDPAGRLHVDGVPHFIVTSSGGKVLREFSGAPVLHPPFAPERLASLETEAFGLP